MHDQRVLRLVRGIPWAVLLLLCSTPALGADAGQTLLLVDDEYVLYRPGTERVVQPFDRHPVNPVIKPDKPWDGEIAWTSVHRDPRTGRYQLWYQAYMGNAARLKTHRCVVCYAESQDGIQFTKPDLGLFSFNDHKATNIVLLANGRRSDRYSNSVVVDGRDPDPGRRYKMAYYDFTMDGGVDRPGLCVAFSPDGIHWTKHPKAPLVRTAYGFHGKPVPFPDEEAQRPLDVPLTISDAIDVFYDPKRGVFAHYGKMWIDGPDGGTNWKHAMGRVESRDFINWSRPELLLTPDEQDPAYVEFHSTPVFFYQDCYFGLNQILNRADRGGSIHIELGISRDGLRWQRPFRNRPVLSPTAKGAFDSQSIFTNSTPVFLEDEMRFYYGAYSSGAVYESGEKQASGIGLATLPRDRFAGLRPMATSAPYPLQNKPFENVGQVTLKPLDFRPYDVITLNADASKGVIRAELLDESSYRVRGFSHDEAVPIKGDSLRHEVAWKGRHLADLPAGKYHLRLHLENATVYAVSFRCNKSGSKDE